MKNLNKKCLITGVTGQVGSYLAEILLSQGHDVWGIKRRTSTNNTKNISDILSNGYFRLIEGDCLDNSFISELIHNQQFDEVYHLAAQSHVATSFKIPEYTTSSIYNSTLFLLEAIRKYSKKTRFYFAGTSEMFGKNFSTTKDGIKYQDENTAFIPQSPYSIAKLAGYHLTRLYREAYNLYACTGILFNNESPRRGEEFVTQKIVKYAAKLYEFQKTSSPYLYPRLVLGNLSASRDWGYSKDYAGVISLFLEQDRPQDLVISSGETHTIYEFLNLAFCYFGLDYRRHVVIDKEFYRPAEVDYLCGDSSLGRKILNWKPSVTFHELIRIMCEAAING